MNDLFGDGHVWWALDSLSFGGWSPPFPPLSLMFLSSRWRDKPLSNLALGRRRSSTLSSTSWTCCSQCSVKKRREQKHEQRRATVLARTQSLDCVVPVWISDRGVQRRQPQAGRALPLRENGNLWPALQDRSVLVSGEEQEWYSSARQHFAHR
jgi:hypothetical protein